MHLSFIIVLFILQYLIVVCLRFIDIPFFVILIYIEMRR